jgi:hypothetical protein
MKKIEEAFLDNKYPIKFIKNTIAYLTRSNNKDPQRNTKKLQNPKFVPIPFINQGSYIHIKKLAKFNIVPAFSTSTKNKSVFTNTKNKINKKDINNVVYKINCKECNKNYIGSTSQPLKARLNQHKSDTNIKPNSTALAKHANGLNHSFDYENTKILETESNTRKRLLLEILHIKTEEHACNSKKDIADLPPEYETILSKKHRGH